MTPPPAAGRIPGTWAIYDRTERVLDVHRRYAVAGCDLISTHTWGILASGATARGRRPGRTGLPAWTVAAHDAVGLAREGIRRAGRAGRCSVAFSLNDADPLLADEQALLGLLWNVDAPDLVLVETLASVPSPPLLAAITAVTASGMPVWVSFRRVAPTSGEEPGAFSRALAGLEAAGVRAVLLNCIPVPETRRALEPLVAATTLPVGCYPRLDGDLEPAQFAALAAGWREAGARIVGGCCGVRPAHLVAVRARIGPEAKSRA